MAKEKKGVGIERKTRQQLEELKNTLYECPHVETVHFTESGNHYFSVHELVDKGKKNGNFYGHLKLEPVVHKTVGERRYYKKKSVHTPSTLIVKSMSREEVLNYEYAGPDDTAKGQQISNLTLEELMRQIGELRAQLDAKPAK